ncbi:tyrosine-type recombinase/integrase [Janibacter anophelis]|uniref:tyrosine-type recombinase/integrase n=1 Tax=Janibacter anophelis TaxID=319054 RepID=UPI003F807669
MTKDLQALGASFSRSLKADGKAERTRVLYLQSVTYFSRWLVARGLEPTLANLTKDNLREWLGDLHEANRPATVRTRFRGMRRFCGWLVEDDELESNPMQGISPPSAPAEPVPVITDEELAALLKACRGKELADLRDTAIIRLLLDCGLRASELCGLRLQDVDLDAESVIVKGKGDKVRAAYMSARTTAALDKYLRKRAGHRWAHLPQVFLTQRGALSPDGLRERVRARGEAAGIAHLHPHRFRHTFAHDYLLNGGQERDLKRLAGWTSDTMLERYGASAADERAKAAAQRMRRGDRV